MNVLWQQTCHDLPSRRQDKSALRSLMIILEAARGGGVPPNGMGISVGCDLIHWKPTGEVVTIGGMEK